MLTMPCQTRPIDGILLADDAKVIIDPSAHPADSVISGQVRSSPSPGNYSYLLFPRTHPPPESQPESQIARCPNCMPADSDQRAGRAYEK